MATDTGSAFVTPRDGDEDEETGECVGSHSLSEESVETPDGLLKPEMTAGETRPTAAVSDTLADESAETPDEKAKPEPAADVSHSQAEEIDAPPEEQPKPEPAADEARSTAESSSSFAVSHSLVEETDVPPDEQPKPEPAADEARSAAESSSSPTVSHSRAKESDEPPDEHPTPGLFADAARSAADSSSSPAVSHSRAEESDEPSDEHPTPGLSADEVEFAADSSPAAADCSRQDSSFSNSDEEETAEESNATIPADAQDPVALGAEKTPQPTDNIHAALAAVKSSEHVGIEINEAIDEEKEIELARTEKDSVDVNNAQVEIDVPWNPFGEQSVPQSLSVDENERKQSAQLSLFRLLDEEYERALEDREVAWKAQYASVRTSAFLSILFMLVYLTLGCLFYRSQTTWTIPDSLIFAIYTITTVGYGNHFIPNTTSFQIFTIFYIIIGIAGLTVLGAHTYQFIVLQATKIQFSRDSAELQRRDNSLVVEEGGVGGSRRAAFILELSALVRQRPFLDRALDWGIDAFKRTRKFLRTTRAGQVIYIFLPFLGLILFGAAVVGPLEGWNFVESIYWAVVTLTTIGYGDYYPTKTASIWFSIFYLPSSLFFMSFFLAHVAKSYIKLHNVHVARLESRMRNRIKRAREDAERDALRNDSETSDFSYNDNMGAKQKKTDFEFLPNGELHTDEATQSAQLFGSQQASKRDTSAGLEYRESVLHKSIHGMASKSKSKLSSMKEILKSMRPNKNKGASIPADYAVDYDSNFNVEGRALDTSSHAALGAGSPLRKGIPQSGSRPSLAVRMMVQERLAQIIATDVAGYQSGIVIKDTTMSIAIDSLRDTAEKWMLPSRAWKPFRAVAFQSIVFVGEHDLITKGGDALLSLSALEFHGMFSPLLAAMGDGENMEAWLASTDVLADVELKKTGDGGDFPEGILA